MMMMNKEIFSDKTVLFGKDDNSHYQFEQINLIVLI